ncbi:MAG: hypothetical protein ABEI11_03310 [Haloarculaceae archaeon]
MLRIDGDTYDIERDHLHTLIEAESPAADIARALLALDESTTPIDPAEDGTRRAEAAD